jgi:dipeptidyl aminopeptidase/acylaminoacyl peptidase
MRKTRHRVCLAVLPLFVCLAGTAAAAPPGAEAFGAVPQTSNVVISPDGKTLAWEARSGADTGVTLFDVESRKIKRVQRFEASMKLRSLDWADNEVLLIGMSMADSSIQSEDHRFEFFRVVALDTSTGNFKFLLMSGGSRGNVTGADVLAMRSARPKTVIMSTLDFSEPNERVELGSHIENRRKDSGWALSAYEVDTLTGAGAMLESGGPFTEDFVIDRTGKVVARSDWNPAGRQLRVLAKSGLAWRELMRAPDHDAFVPQGLSDDGSAILGLSSRPGEGRKLVALPLDGSPLRTVFSDPQREITAVVHDSYTGQATALILGGAAPEYHWLAAQDQQLYDQVAQAFPGKFVALTGQSQDRQRVVVFVTAPSSPGVFYLVDFKAHSADIVGEEYPALVGAALGEQRTLVYKARDGTEISAYLTIPPGMEAKGLPLIVLPHGGPEWRDYPHFDWWSQFFATRGYAVLQPQFRGSTGFGDAFRLAGRRQWGGLMQDDITDGVKALVGQGVADGSRVCIVGASYGGYAALAGAAFTPELYACAVSVNGPSNLLEMLAWETAQHGKESSTVGYWVDSIGPRLDPQLLAKSPAKAVERIKAPILLIYSADDTVVPPSQSREMAQALKEHGTAFELVKLDGDDHWLSRTDSRVQMLRKVEDFLAGSLRR